jgi:hypothetical protein
MTERTSIAKDRFYDRAAFVLLQKYWVWSGSTMSIKYVIVKRVLSRRKSSTETVRLRYKIYNYADKMIGVDGF